MSPKHEWYSWPRNKQGQLIITCSEDAQRLAKIVSGFPYARRLIEKKIKVLDKCVAQVHSQSIFKLEYGIKLATEVQLLREVLSFALARSEKGGTEHVRPQVD